MENSKDLTYFSCMLVSKLFNYPLQLRREDQQSLHMKRVIGSACEKVITSACKKAIACVCEKAITSVVLGGRSMINAERINSQLSHRGGRSTINAERINCQMENSKDLTYLSCMLVLKLFTLLFTIDAERINSPCT